MNKLSIIITALLCCVCTALNAGTPAEYWVDNDPGRGQATTISLSSGVGQANISTSGLSYGWHTIGLRARRNGNWSQTYTKAFYVPDPLSLSEDLTAVEYWLNNDPGFGHATPIPFSPQQTLFTFDLQQMDTLSSGYHRIGIRVRRGSRWSETYTRGFANINLPEQMTLGDVVAYWDGDTTNLIPLPYTMYDTYGQATNVQISTANLSYGAHKLYLRATADNIHSVTLCYEIQKDPILGDINEDGIVNVMDATALIGAYLKGTTDSLQQSIADVNHDGVINVMDATEIINIYLHNR